MELKKEVKDEILRIVGFADGGCEKTMGEIALEIRDLGMSNEEVLRALAELAGLLDLTVLEVIEAAVALFKS